MTRSVYPVPGLEKPSYTVGGGKTKSLVDRHVIRDTLTLMRKDWAAKEKQLLAATGKETKKANTSTQELKAKKKALKQELALQKKEYFAEQARQARAEKDKVRLLRQEFWKRKEQVLAEARKEMVKVLVEDENLWDVHPREMMNRRYLTLNKTQWKSPFN